ncbi:hypothetical protein BGX31_002582 [Mortierella sp. GBA43]|nr:hypothetical protein BGX31_002582 [Mortierella sp. GBA43]
MIPVALEPPLSTPPPELQTDDDTSVFPTPLTALPKTTPLPDLENFNLRPEQRKNPVFVAIYGIRYFKLASLGGQTPRGTIRGAISTALALSSALKTFDPIEKLRLNSTTYYRMDVRVLDPSALPPEGSSVLKSRSKRSKSDRSNPKQVKRKTVRAMSTDSTITDSSDEDNRRHSNLSSSKRVRIASPSSSSRSKGIPNGLKKLPKGYVYDTDVDGATLMDLSVNPSQTGEFIEHLKGQNTSETAYPDRRHQYGVDLTQKPSLFAVEQQTGYTYPRLRTSRRERLLKPDCEDGYAITDLKYSGGYLGRLFCLTDGHGGRACSSFVIATVPEALQVVLGKYKPSDMSIPSIQDEVKSQITEVIRVIDKEYLDYKKEQYLLYKAKKTDYDPGSDGTTLIVNIFIDKWLICVNVGDSRSILGSRDASGRWNVDFYSEDHTPSLERLAQTIYANGGEFVTHDDKVIKFDPNLKIDKKHRLSLKDARIRVKDGASNLYGIPYYRTRNGHAASINLGACIGDVLYKLDPAKPILNCKPDITFIDLSDNHYGYLLMASDGLWDYVQRGGKVQEQNTAVCQFVGDKLDRGWSNARIVNMLSDREGTTGLYSDSIQEYDDFTAILVVISDQDPPEVDEQLLNQQSQAMAISPLQQGQMADQQDQDSIQGLNETERAYLAMGAFEAGLDTDKMKVIQWIGPRRSMENPVQQLTREYVNQLFDDESDLSEPPASMDMDSADTAETDSASEIDIDDSTIEREPSPSASSEVDVESTH